MAWRAGNNGCGKRPWFVLDPDARRYHEDARGLLIRYGSCAAATRVAERLNAA